MIKEFFCIKIENLRIKYFAMFALTSLILGVCALVYMTGGIKYVYSHSM